ncbi:hypothetical protein OG562_25690 [Streptomyces sp. NBC_01275]|uniref:hypothetical protein n=1 Tax=Streptomyces sp. NBC_01275 TaxID=2903807 RepID=UPI0022541455|nr:hypothetical protein [Streptomyces sp. NBC_01275]MCX4764291.1 hypothetical protein [Streptomyces sp. NBC_01275]
MSEVKSVPADYGRSRLTARTRWRATRHGRRDGHAGIGAEHCARQLAGGLEMALDELRSGFVTRHAALIDRVKEESARIVTEYDRRGEDVPAALARFGGWVSQWRTEVTACQQRGLALAACADQELAHYQAAYARAARQEEPPPAQSPGAAVLDGSWTGAPDWMLDDVLVRRALQILEQRIGSAAAQAGRGEQGTR